MGYQVEGGGSRAWGAGAERPWLAGGGPGGSLELGNRVSQAGSIADPGWKGPPRRRERQGPFWCPQVVQRGGQCGGTSHLLRGQVAFEHPKASETGHSQGLCPGARLQQLPAVKVASSKV